MISDSIEFYVTAAIDGESLEKQDVTPDIFTGNTNVCEANCARMHEFAHTVCESLSKDLQFATRAIPQFPRP